ncbi:MAG: hypothetical protein ACRC5M_07305 [Anaeroplasmataceae bacterium]
MLLKREELKEGNCIVVATTGTELKEFEGYCKSKLDNVVFYTMAHSYERILGYKQEV